MSEEEYINRIKNLENNISVYNQKLKQIRENIEETEDALEYAKKYKTQFNESIRERRAKKNIKNSNNQMKLVKSLMIQLDNLFSGKRFARADDSIDVMVETIKKKLKGYYDEYEKYEKLIKTTKISVSTAENDLKNYRANLIEE